MTTNPTTPGNGAELSSIGLLVLRITTGGAMLQGGLIKALDFSSAEEFMETAGWRLPTFAAFLVTAAEVLGGIGLLLGVLTPLAATAIVAAMLDAWAVNVSGAAVWSDPFNVPLLLAAAAATLLFTGAGVYSVDAKLLGRMHWPTRLTVGLLVVALAAAVITWVALNGTNPIHVTAPQ